MTKLKRVPSPNTPTSALRSYLYNDPFFTKAADRLKEKVTENHGTEIVMPVSQDLLEDDIVVFDDTDLSLILKVAEKFKIRTDDVLMYFVYKKTGILEDKVPVIYAEITGRVVISLYPENTLEDIHAVWPYVQQQQASVSGKQRNRLPDDYSLIYAIYRMRVIGKKPAEIFRLYTEGELPSYSGSASQFSTKESLMTHFGKYDPTSIT